MSDSDNIEFFNRFTLALLERLHAEFPTPVDINVKAIAGSLLPEDVELEIGFKRITSADDAVSFLESEGFITHAGTYLSGGEFLQMRLTAKGLAVLNSTPTSLQVRKPLIAQIRELAVGGMKTATSEGVKLLANHVMAAVVNVAQ